MPNKMWHKVLYLIIIACGFGKSLLAEQRDLTLAGVETTHLHSLDLIASELTEDLSQVTRNVKAVIAQYSQSAQLPYEFEQIALMKLSEAFAKSSIKAIRCSECIQVTAKIENNEFVVTRGLPTGEDLVKLLKKFKTDTYVTINITVAANSMILGIRVANNKTAETYFQKEYKKPIYPIENSGFVFSLTGGVARMKETNMLGGRAAIGRRLSRVGDVGIFGTVYTDDDARIDTIFGGGMFFDLDLNDITSSYWRWGSFLVTMDLGMVATRSSLQGSAAVGLKQKIGRHLHIRLGYNQFFLVRRNQSSKASTSPNPPNFEVRDKLPGAILMGLGMDL